MSDQPTKLRQFDFEDRTLDFAVAVRALVKQVPNTPANWEDMRQVTRSSGSIGANYREANEAISKKDFLHRVRIARKEAQETQYWLHIIGSHADEHLMEHCNVLAAEAKEIMMILGAILRNAQRKE